MLTYMPSDRVAEAPRTFYRIHHAPSSRRSRLESSPRAELEVTVTYATVSTTVRLRLASVSYPDVRLKAERPYGFARARFGARLSRSSHKSTLVEGVYTNGR